MINRWIPQITGAILGMMLVFSCQATAQKSEQWRAVKKLPPRQWKMLRLELPPKAPDITWRSPMLTAVCFIDDMNGWVVGEGGTLAVTTDGGKTWKTSVLNPTAYLHAVFFLDKKWGWTAGNLDEESHSVIFRTQDGGKNWRVQQQIGGFDLISINGLWFIDERHGWAVGNTEKDGKGYGVIWETTDGGEHWDVRYQSKSRDGFRAINFVDEKSGWVTGTDTVLHLENGRQWQEMYRAKEEDDYFFMDFQFTSATEGWIVGGMFSGKILHTLDGGKTWRASVLPTTRKPLYFITTRFVDPLRGWVGAGNGIVLSTIDGGNNWTIRKTGQREAIRGLAITSRAVFAVGTEGVILRQTR